MRSSAIPAANNFQNRGNIPTGRRKFSAAARLARIRRAHGLKSPYIVSQNEGLTVQATTMWTTKTTVPSARYTFCRARRLTEHLPGADRPRHPGIPPLDLAQMEFGW